MWFLKKKITPSALELPPPPSLQSMPRPMGDIPSIKPPTGPPELPEMPHEELPFELPEPPAPELPEIPKPEYEKNEEYEKPAYPELVQIEEKPSVFERAVEERVRRPVGPAFVSIDEYRAILENSNRVRAKLSEAEQMMHRLEEIKSEEEKTFDKWRAQLEDAEHKLEHIDRLIAKAQR